jgi:ACS family hexuronate transporter-like MFS transporter
MSSNMNLRYRWIILIFFVISQILLSIAGFGWGALAPFLKKEMFLSDSQIGAISSVFYFAAASSAFPTGIGVDRFGVKIGVMLWLALTGVPLVLMSLFRQEYVLLLGLVALSGFGYGMGNPVASKGLYLWFDQRIRGTVFGIRQAAVTGGAAVAGLFLVALSQKAGPFVALRITGLMIVTMILFALFFYRTPGDAHPVHPNAVDRGARPDEGNFRILFKNRPLLVVSVASALLGLAQGVVATFFILFLNERLGISLLAAGSFYTLLMASGALGRILWGVVSDRLFGGRRKPVLMIISVLVTACASVLAFWSATWPRHLLVPVIVMIGLSSVGWNAIASVLVTEVSGDHQTATSVGLSSTIGWLGIFLGPIGFGTLLDHSGYVVAWLALAFCCFLSFILCLVIPGSK